jgi:hypothetical protein
MTPKESAIPTLPSVPMHIINAITQYGDARADDGLASGPALGNVVRSIREHYGPAIKATTASPQPAPWPILTWQERGVAAGWTSHNMVYIDAYIADLRAALAAPATVDRNLVLEEVAIWHDKMQANTSGTRAAYVHAESARAIRALKSAAPANVPQPAVPEGCKIMRDALEKLACLGNGNHWGTSKGNLVAQEALEATTAVAQPAAQGAWKPMTAAPEDGTEILLRYPLQANVKQLACFNTIHKHWSSKGQPIFPVEQGCEWTDLLSDNAPAEQSTDKPAEGA